MSKFVDQMSITDESGNIKKEININFGDPLAREQSQKAMRDSEQAKQTANEAKQIAENAKQEVKEIAENAKQEVKEIAENAAEEVAGAKAVEVTGVREGRIQWTDNWYVNLVINSLEYVGIRDYHNISGMSFKKRSEDNSWRFVVREGSFSDSFELMDGFNEFNVRGGQFVFRMLVELDALNRLEEHVDGVGFKLNDNVVRWYEKNPAITNAEFIGVNKSSIDLVESNLTDLKELIYQIVIPSTPYGIVYKKSNLSPIEVTETGLADNIDLVSQGNFEYIYKCDFTGLSDLRNIFVDAGIYGENRITKKITLNNGAIDGAGLSYLVYKLRTLTNLDFVNVDTSNVTNLTCSFALISCEKLDLSKLNFSRVHTFRFAFSDNSGMKELILPSGMSEGQTIDALGAFTRIGCETLILDFATSAQAGNMENMFYSARVKNLQILNISFENATNVNNVLYGCGYLTTFSGLSRIKKSYSIYSKQLTHESALNCIAGLYDLTEGGTVTDYTAQTLSFSSEVKAQLTEEEIAEATAKGWNIA